MRNILKDTGYKPVALKAALTAALKAALMILVLLLMVGRVRAEVCGEAVATREGPVTGRAEGGGGCAYKGIPYAAAPVGERRWRPPGPAEKRGAVLAAERFGPECLQPDVGLSSLIASKDGRSEDCLFLNIWRPAKSGDFPVMVYIHGGDLLQGSGSMEMYWGDRLAVDQEVVVVTINYRLGPLGYLYHRSLAAEDAHGSAGNYGLMDQAAALTWVRDNIAGFGGDAGLVTIFGESAGGWSVCHLLASPLAAGLFQRAIIESGGCECARSVEQGAAFGDEFAARLGCAGADAASCLRSKSGPEVIAAMGKDWQAMLAKFFPHIDGYALREAPLAAIAGGRWNRVPLLAGSTRDEFKLFSNELPGGRWLPGPMLMPAARKYLRADLDEAGFRRRYPFRDYRRDADALIDGIGEAYLGCPTYRAADAAAGTEANTYYYRFDYDAHLAPHVIGAAHGTEVPFVFDGLDRPPMRYLYSRAQTRRAQELGAAMRRYWTNFARTGNPNGGALPSWPAYTPDGQERMLLDLPLSSGRAEMGDKCEWWANQPIVVH